MTALVIDKDVALGALSGVVEKFGVEHVYPSDELAGCWYVVRDANGQPQPACIVGQALWGLGVDPEVIESLNYAGPLAADENVQTLLDAGVEMTPGGLGVLRKAQQWQDMGNAWGHSLAEAQEVYLRFEK